MGSDSDFEVMREAAKALEGFGIAYEIDIASAHRSPQRTAAWIRPRPRPPSAGSRSSWPTRARPPIWPG